MTDWHARMEAIRKLDQLGDEAHAIFKADWIAAYSAAFVQIATERGWTLVNAESWPPNIAQDSFLEAYRANFDPAAMAAIDVSACEEEAP